MTGYGFKMLGMFLSGIWNIVDFELDQIGIRYPASGIWNQQKMD
jgi:hypothetical protein